MRKVLRYLERLHSKLTNYSINKYVMDERELKIEALIQMLLAHPDTKIKPSNLSGTYLLTNKACGYKVVIDNVGFQIANHTFARDRHFNETYINIIKKQIDTKIEEEQKAMLSEMFRDEMNMIDMMINKLTVEKVAEEVTSSEGINFEEVK